MLIRSPEGSTHQMEAAQFLMLQRLVNATDLDFLMAIRHSCEAQLRADTVHYISWSRHFLACIKQVTGASGLVGCSAVTFHPHFNWYSSPAQSDTELGSRVEWPTEQCVLLLDAIPPDMRNQLLSKAFNHDAWVWIIRLDKHTQQSVNDRNQLSKLKATLYAQFPAKELLQQKSGCWSTAMYDAQPSEAKTQVWRLGRCDIMQPLLAPSVFRRLLGDWTERREDFHFPADPTPEAMRHYRAAQQDARQYSFEGIVVAVDGSVDRASEKMGAALVTGCGREPTIRIFFPVGGSMASIRPEGASMAKAAEVVPLDVPMLVFGDSLGVYQNLQKWGSTDFHPDPEDIRHFDVLITV